MTRLGGWHRLFIVIALVYAIAVTLYVWTWAREQAYLLENVTGSSRTVAGVQHEALTTGFFLWLIPVAALYGLGYAVSWVRRGFRAGEKTA